MKKIVSMLVCCMIVHRLNSIGSLNANIQESTQPVAISRLQSDIPMTSNIVVKQIASKNSIQTINQKSIVANLSKNNTQQNHDSLTDIKNIQSSPTQDGITIDVSTRKKNYNQLISLGEEKYTSATPDDLRASINTSALGNARTVLPDFKGSLDKLSDAMTAIDDINAKIKVTENYIDQYNSTAYKTLQESSNLLSDIIQDRNNQVSWQARDSAVVNLAQQRTDLGVKYQDLLKILKLTASKDQVSQAVSFVQYKIKNKNSEQLFEPLKIGSYNEFMQGLVGLGKETSDPKKIADWLEVKLTLNKGDISLPPISMKTSMKLESLYQALDLVAISKGSNISGSGQAISFVDSMRGSRLANSDQIKNLMSALKQFEPMSKTTFENKLLLITTDKQAILLTTQYDFIYTTMGRAIKELSALPLKSVVDNQNQVVGALTPLNDSISLSMNKLDGTKEPLAKSVSLWQSVTGTVSSIENFVQKIFSSSSSTELIVPIINSADVSTNTAIQSPRSTASTQQKPPAKPVKPAPKMTPPVKPVRPTPQITASIQVMDSAVLTSSIPPIKPLKPVKNSNV